jgi:hypothetical protein
MDNNRNGVDIKDDRLWKIQDLFEIIRMNFSKFCNPSKHLTVDEVIVNFKLLLTSEDWTHVTISTGLAATPSSGGVTCVQRGA